MVEARLKAMEENNPNAFVPQRCKWVIIKNRNYDQLRLMEGYGSFADIPHVDADAANVKRGVLGLGARQSDIIEMEDADFASLKALRRELADIVSENWRNGEKKTLIFVYYAGHGVMTNMTHVVCNGGKDN